MKLAKPGDELSAPLSATYPPAQARRGHVEIESDSQTSMLNRQIGQRCGGPDQSSLTPGPSGVGAAAGAACPCERRQPGEGRRKASSTEYRREVSSR